MTFQAAVAQPRTVQEVSEAVKFATANNIAFNVKGGGHSTSQASSAPSPEGMIIDLALMRDVSVDPERQTVSFQGGCLWKDVDDALWKHGLATVGGTVSHTGVGGLILHGGFGMLTGVHGLTIDCLVSCEVVLADGSIVTASDEENPDLFWGLRGAGSSFGVVTQFTSRAFPQGGVWAGVMGFSVDKLPAVVDFINTWAETNDGTQAMGVSFAHLPPEPNQPGDSPREPGLVCNVVHVGPDPETRGPEFFAPLLKLEPIMRQVSPMPYPMVNKLGDEAFFPQGRRYQFGGANFTTPLTLSTVEAIRDGFWGFTRAHPGAGTEGSICMLECTPNARARRVPASATAFNNPGNYYNVGIVWTWDDPGLDGEVREYNRSFQRKVRALGYHDDEDRKDGVGRYINYLSSDAVAAEVAFGSNADRLREIKAKYDPANVFDKLWKLLSKIEER